MSAFRAIVAWEVRYYLRRISTWVYFAIFFSIALLFMLVAGGAWGDVQVALGSGGKVMANAPYAFAPSFRYSRCWACRSPPRWPATRCTRTMKSMPIPCSTPVR